MAYWAMPLPGFTRRNDNPYLASGSWETGSEGWSLSSVSRFNVAGRARTGIWYLSSNIANSTATFTIPDGVVNGKTLNARVYYRGFSSAAYSLSLLVSVGGGSYVQIASASSTSVEYDLLSGSQIISGAGDVSVRILFNTIGTSTYVDDWEITAI